MANPEATKPLRPDEAGKDGAGNPPPPPFLEVACRSSGEVRRFAAGTTARYALHAVNRKLSLGAPAALHVEAAKDGEEPVRFGPTAPLADYGQGWKLQTVTEQDAPGIHHPPPHDTSKKRGEDAQRHAKEALHREALKKKSASVYLAKIGLAFVFIFLLGGLFTYLLEKLPAMIQPASTRDPEPSHVSVVLVLLKREGVLVSLVLQSAATSPRHSCPKNHQKPTDFIYTYSNTMRSSSSRRVCFLICFAKSNLVSSPSNVNGT